MKRLVIGRVTYRPEMREEFLAMSLAHQAATRAEPGCEFFEIALSLDRTERGGGHRVFHQRGGV